MKRRYHPTVIYSSCKQKRDTIALRSSHHQVIMMAYLVSICYLSKAVVKTLENYDHIYHIWKFLQFAPVKHGQCYRHNVTNQTGLRSPAYRYFCVVALSEKQFEQLPELPNFRMSIMIPKIKFENIWTKFHHHHDYYTLIKSWNTESEWSATHFVERFAATFLFNEMIIMYEVLIYQCQSTYINIQFIQSSNNHFIGDQHVTF